MFKYLALIALLLPPAGFAQAACVTAPAGTALSANVSWVAPTKNTDSTAIANPMTYNLYQATTSGAEKKVASGITTLTSIVATGLLHGTTYYFTVTAVDANGTESVQSNEVCKSFPNGIPGAVTITIS